MQVQRPITLIFPPTPGAPGYKSAGDGADSSGVENGALAAAPKTLPVLTDRLEDSAQAQPPAPSAVVARREAAADVTYTRSGRMGASDAGRADAFAREAANTMRDFYQNQAAAHASATADHAGNDHAMAAKLRASLQSVVSKLHVFA